MATFRVGQRVRIDCPGSDVNGRETTITRIGIVMTWYEGTHLVHEVDIPHERYGRYAFRPRFLVPIQPERNRVVAWEDLNLPFDPRKIAEVA